MTVTPIRDGLEIKHETEKEIMTAVAEKITDMRAEGFKVQGAVYVVLGEAEDGKATAYKTGWYIDDRFTSPASIPGQVMMAAGYLQKDALEG